MSRIPVGQLDLDKFKASAFGQQDVIYIVGVPDGVSKSLINQSLLGQALTVAGDYDCLIPMAGMASEIEAHLTATLAGGATGSIELVPLYYTVTPQTPSTWLDKGTPDTAALVDGTLTSVNFARLKGEQWARFTLVKAGGGTLTVTRAEFNGL